MTVVPRDIVVHIPEQPPIGTVVVTANGEAYQRVHNGFLSSVWRGHNRNGNTLVQTWPGLVAAGPLTVVYEPEPKP